MTREELATRNLILGGEFTKHILEHPDLLERIPDEAHVILLPEDDPQLCEENRKIARKRLEDGEAVVYVKVERMLPEKSRLVNPQIEMAA